MAPHDLVLLVGLAALGVVELLIYMDGPHTRRKRRASPSARARRRPVDEELPTT